MKITWLLITAIFYSTQLFATITIEPISGATLVIDPTTASLQVVAGFNGTCPSPSTGLCNTCQNPATACGPGDPNCCGVLTCQMCNTQAATDTTILTIPFTSDTTATGLPRLTLGTQSVDSTTGVGSGGRFVFTSPWSNVCSLLTEGTCTCASISDGTCDKLGSTTVISRDVTITVQGGDSASIKFELFRQSQLLAEAGKNGSLTAYSLYPGDEKVYVLDPTIVGYAEGSDFPAVSDVRVFIGTGSFTNAYVQNDGTGVGETIEPATLAVDANGIDQVVDGLENDQLYHFRTASIDEAGNVYAFMDNAYLIAEGCTNPNQTGGIDGTDTNLCKYAAKPSRVLGLLTEDMNCFVATAAYGSSLDPHIDTFRDFRFRVLLRSELGQKLNYAYYNYGPKMARFIKDRAWAQTVSRAILWPAWGFASISLYFQMNLWQTFLFFFSSLGVFFVSGFYLVRLASRRMWS